MNESIKNAIDVYIQEEKSDYAIMLNGPWGCGKTYFVKNELIDYLQDELEDKNKQKFKRNVFYISLFGISNLDELYNNIALQILNIKTTEYLDEKKRLNNPLSMEKNEKVKFVETNKLSWISGIINKGLKIFPKNEAVNSVITEIYKNKINFNKYIFVFDDLERSTLNCNELLGFFDQITDQNGMKAILICNEAKMNKKHYKKFKEKVIGLTIDYHSDIDNNFDSLAEMYLNDEECKRYVIKSKKDILYLFLKDLKNYIMKF